MNEKNTRKEKSISFFLQFSTFSYNSFSLISSFIFRNAMLRTLITMLFLLLRVTGLIVVEKHGETGLIVTSLFVERDRYYKIFS